ncbi:MAG TPA: HlyD family secretion protein [Candidatus Omnitrophota bacterium]|nr:HlyD family secretion protein [Candidatus Omnitrophota bacterium]
MNTPPVSGQTPQSQTPLWRTARVKWLAASFAAAIVLIFAVWLIFFRSYIYTNDARIATDIVRVSPVGVGGVINKVLVQEGDNVTTGETLVEIDHGVPEAQFNKAKANYEMARLELERARDLATNNFNSKRDLDRAQTGYDVAAAEYKLADINLQNTYLKSPIGGVVIQKLAEVGNVLEPGQVAVAIADVDHAWVSANIEETKVGSIKVGQPVKITLDEGGTLTGHVQEITVATASQFSLLPTENASGNFTKVVQKIPIKIALDPHPEHRMLRAGQSVTVRIRVR